MDGTRRRKNLEGDYTVKGRLGVIGEELWDGEVFDVELSSSTNLAGP
jgi:hypothetical protein